VLCWYTVADGDVEGDGDFSDEMEFVLPRLGRAGGLFRGHAGTTSNQDRHLSRDRARELAELYASMKAMRYGRR